MAITTETLLVEKIKTLSEAQQQEVIEFVEKLQKNPCEKPSKKSLLGALAHLNIDISKEEIDQARKEMWANFPRENF